MKRNYEALFGAFFERYFEFKTEKMSDSEAIACTADAYYGVQSRGEMEKAVVHIAEGRIYLTHSKVFIKAKENIVKVLRTLDLKKLQLETTPDEYQDIMERIEMVLDRIDSIPVDYSPYARWYYYEMEKEVKLYFGIINRSLEDGSELVERILKRFERECNNTISENIIVKTTLAEILIKYDINEAEQTIKLRRELEEFDLNDVNDQLTENEKIDLSLRIKDILSKL